MASCSKSIKSFLFSALLAFVVSCGQNGGVAPGAGTSTEDNCGGEVVGGFCWYLAADNESCDSVCSTRGGHNEGTRTFAGSDGSAQNCGDVLNALVTLSGVVNDFPCAAGMGCMLGSFGNVKYRCTSPATDSSSSNASENRACACNE
jgi:hypothetical protein